MRLSCVRILLVCVVCLVACVPPLDPAVQAINNAISNLTSNSTAWQATLQNLQAQLIAQGQSTLANEVQSVLNRGIATANAQFLCDAKFLADQLAQALRNIVADIQHKPRPGEPPHFCTVDPSSIDLGVQPDRRSTLNIYGFNFTTNNINVAVVDNSGSRNTPAPGIFTVGTEFVATLNIRDYPFTATSSYVSFMLPAGEEKTVSIIQPPTCGRPGLPCCQPANTCDPGLGCLNATCTTCPPPYVPTTQEYLRKDREFEGNNWCGFGCPGNHWEKTYGGTCHDGWHREQCVVQILDRCDPNSSPPHCNAYEISKSWAANDCECTVGFDTPNDATKGIHINMIITETTNPPIRPQGCP